MRKFTFSVLILTAITLVSLQSCVDDSNLVAPKPVPDQSFVEEFDNIQMAYDKGWRMFNKSENIGTMDWGAGQRGDATFAPYSSRTTNAGYLATDYQATAGAASTISNWAVSPSVIMQNGDKIIFYTRCQTYTGGLDYGNRLQVRMNSQDDGLNVGDQIDPGHFTTALLDINPSYIEAPANGAYPSNWTRFEATVYGLDKPAARRFAFRYFVEGAGSAGRGSAVGVDSVAYVSISRK